MDGWIVGYHAPHDSHAARLRDAGSLTTQTQMYGVRRRCVYLSIYRSIDRSISPLTTHYSLLTTHYSLLYTTYYSLRNSLLTTTQYSQPLTPTLTCPSLLSSAQADGEKECWSQVQTTITHVGIRVNAREEARVKATQRVALSLLPQLKKVK